MEGPRAASGDGGTGRSRRTAAPARASAGHGAAGRCPAAAGAARESRDDLESMALPILLREGGPVMPLILLAALVGYVLAVERLLAWAADWRRERPFLRAPDAAALLARVRAVADATAAPPATVPPAVAVLAAALALRPLAPEDREAALQPVLLEQWPRAEARIGTIGWLGTILPMLGLLGTVSGMITTFRELAVTTSRQVLSQGLSEALWTTEVGLLAAVPLLAVHHGLTRLKARRLNRLERALALLWAPEAPATPGEAPPHAP